MAAVGLARSVTRELAGLCSAPGYGDGVWEDPYDPKRDLTASRAKAKLEMNR